MTVVSYVLRCICCDAFIDSEAGLPSAMNVVLVVVVTTKAFSFHTRSLSNFANTLVTMLSTIAPCQIFKLSPN